MLLTYLFLMTMPIHAAELKEKDPAPLFTAATHDGKSFDLKDRKGQWTVLYFYPKAGTPGCTKQACAYRDSIVNIRALGAEVFGVSADTPEALAKFHKEHNLNFTLLADPKGKVIDLYGTKMPVVTLSKRWTYVIDPELKIRSLMKDVDPILDAQKVADVIRSSKASKQ